MMKNYKFILLLIALLTPFIVFIVKNNSPKSIVKKTIPEEKKVSNLSPPKVFSLPNTPKEEKKVPKIFGRKIFGQKKFDKNLKVLNKYNPKWKNILEKYLVKFQNKTVSVDVKLNEAYIMIKNNQGRLVEEVTVNYSEKGEHISSFKAMVDSETGAILKTFDKITIQERRKPYPRLKPTGSIKNPPARRIKKD
jgi:hypothetical protein